MTNGIKRTKDKVGTQKKEERFCERSRRREEGTVIEREQKFCSHVQTSSF